MEHVRLFVLYKIQNKKDIKSENELQFIEPKYQMD